MDGLFNTVHPVSSHYLHIVDKKVSMILRVVKPPSNFRVCHYFGLRGNEPRRSLHSLPDLLPRPFQTWFAEKGWAPRAHQMELLARATAGENMLLIAPTGAGKTLAGFLPSLTDLTRRGKTPPGSAFVGVHTLYISPLKALAVDIERNLMKRLRKWGCRSPSRTARRYAAIQAPAAEAQPTRHPL